MAQQQAGTPWAANAPQQGTAAGHHVQEMPHTMAQQQATVGSKCPTPWHHPAHHRHGTTTKTTIGKYLYFDLKSGILVKKNSRNLTQKELMDFVE